VSKCPQCDNMVFDIALKGEHWCKRTTCEFKQRFVATPRVEKQTKRKRK